MRWLGGRRNKKLVPAWSYSARGVIWKLLPVRGKYFVAEERDVDLKTATFSCIETSAGRVLWSGIACQDGWWSGIESVCGNSVLLHGYETPDMPDHRKIHAFDIDTGRKLWSDERLKFLFAGDASIYASVLSAGLAVFLEINPSDGSEVRRLEPGDIESIRNNLSPQGEEGFPSVMPTHQGDRLLAQAFKAATAGYGGIRFAEYISAGSSVAVGFYSEGSGVPPTLRQDIAVVREGKVVYRDLLNSGVNSPVPDTFFSIGGLLYYIKVKKILTALSL